MCTRKSQRFPQILIKRIEHMKMSPQGKLSVCTAPQFSAHKDGLNVTCKMFMVCNIKCLLHKSGYNSIFRYYTLLLIVSN